MIIVGKVHNCLQMLSHYYYQESDILSSQLTSCPIKLPRFENSMPFINESTSYINVPEPPPKFLSVGGYLIYIDTNLRGLLQKLATRSLHFNNWLQGHIQYDLKSKQRIYIILLNETLNLERYEEIQELMDQLKDITDQQQQKFFDQNFRSRHILIEIQTKRKKRAHKRSNQKSFFYTEIDVNLVNLCQKCTYTQFTHAFSLWNAQIGTRFKIFEHQDRIGQLTLRFFSKLMRFCHDIPMDRTRFRQRGPVMDIILVYQRDQPPSNEEESLKEAYQVFKHAND